MRLLALTHLSIRYLGADLRDEARAVFPATEVPRDFDSVEIPFPERGGAQLVRWSERLRAGRGEGPTEGAAAAAAAGETEPVARH